MSKQKTAAKQTKRLEREYQLLMQHVFPSLPEPPQRETFEQPDPYPYVQTMTTYGAYEPVP